MVKIYIDGKMYYANESDNLLQTCLSLGIDIPYFCWHPLLKSLGACRQCAVTQYNSPEDKIGRLVMSCMTPVMNNILISTKSNESSIFRTSMIELLLTNHPHDCPICEEGGHCHLQDMTVLTKHHLRNYRFKKRTHKNQYLGSFIKHEMNRCIGCYRCVRYYKDYSDGLDLGVYGANNNIYFGRIKDGSLESEHSGNLIEICPTGVFTDKIYSKEYTRKWDMQYAPGICQHCSIGCNISIGERYGYIRRIENRYHESINHYLICDLGRFGFTYNSLKNRPKNPFYHNNKNSIILDFNKAISLGVNFFQKYKRIIGVGSSRSSLENNFALKELVGEHNFSNGMLNKEQECIQLILRILKNNQIYTPSLKEIESYDCILILGEDLTQTSPRMSLAVRQAVKNKAQNVACIKGIPQWNASSISHIAENVKNFLYITHTHESKLDDVAEWSYFAPVKDQVNFANAIAHELDNNLPEVSQLTLKLKEKVLLLSKKLKLSKKVLIISGTHSYSSSIIKAAANIAVSVKNNTINHVGIAFVTTSSNSLGVGLMGGMSIESVLEKFHKKEADAVIFMEYDLYRVISQQDCDIFFKNKDNVITIDFLYSETYKKSSLTFPSTSFAESSGTIINFEGRAQRFFQVYDPLFYNKKNCLHVSWKWLHALKNKINNTEMSWLNLDDVVSSYVKKNPILKGVKIKELHSNFRIHNQKIARSPIRSSGRTALRSNIDIHEIEQPKDPNSMFSFSMEGYHQPNKSMSHIPFTWFPGWNSPQALNKFQIEVGKNSISGDSGIHLFKKQKKVIESYFDLNSQVFQEEECWYVIPYYHIFGNEELTQYSSTIQKNISVEYMLISVLDSDKLNLKKDSIVKFTCLNKDYFLSIRLSKHLNEKQIGLPIGRKGFPIDLVGKKIKCLQEIH